MKKLDKLSRKTLLIKLSIGFIIVCIATIITYLLVPIILNTEIYKDLITALYIVYNPIFVLPTISMQLFMIMVSLISFRVHSIQGAIFIIFINVALFISIISFAYIISNVFVDM